MPNDLPHEFKTLTYLREEREDQGRNPSLNPTMGDVINYRFSRRSVLTGSLAVAAIAATVMRLKFL
jgi:uncharacterized protein